MAAKQKLTLYFPEKVVKETKKEALRQDRSISWIMEIAWKVAREHIQEMPGIDELTELDKTG